MVPPQGISLSEERNRSVTFPGFARRGLRSRARTDQLSFTEALPLARPISIASATRCSGREGQAVGTAKLHHQRMSIRRLPDTT
jgi:hypothetical protein